MASERAYDGIIIGAGHHGLILGAYLARAGLKVLLTERRLEHGGGLMTHAATLPGFYHNLHSINHFHITETPWYRDLELTARVPYITPHYEWGQPLVDGRCLVFSRSLEETLASIARFSEKDARTFREWNRKAEAITADIFLPERFAEPLPEAERRALLGRTALGREFLDLADRQPFDVVDALFENEQVKVMFLFKVSLFGTWLVDTLGKSSPMGSVIRAFDVETGYQICRGGSWNLARGLMEVFIANGGHYVNQAEIARIEVTGGRATGVALADGRSFKARQFVASCVDVHQTFETMVGRDQLPPEYRRKVETFKYTQWSLYGLHLALDEPPRYSAAAFDPNIDQVLKFNIGGETVQDLMDAHREVVEKKVPTRIHFGAGALSVLDPAQAPAGKHTAYAWHVMPMDPEGNPDRIEDVKEEFAERILERWAEYAPNMTRRNVLGQYIYTARDYTRDLINMRDGDIFMGAFSADQVMYNHFGYRTPIEGLYMAGSAAHPGGAISGGAGYISAGLIARDLGLEPWWRPVDPRETLTRRAAE